MSADAMVLHLPTLGQLIMNDAQLGSDVMTANAVVHANCVTIGAAATFSGFISAAGTTSNDPILIGASGGSMECVRFKGISGSLLTFYGAGLPRKMLSGSLVAIPAFKTFGDVDDDDGVGFTLKPETAKAGSGYSFDSKSSLLNVSYQIDATLQNPSMDNLKMFMDSDAYSQSGNREIIQPCFTKGEQDKIILYAHGKDGTGFWRRFVGAVVWSDQDKTMYSYQEGSGYIPMVFDSTWISQNSSDKIYMDGWIVKDAKSLALTAAT